MATTLVISPTTNTMLKMVLYSGYLKPSFLMQVEPFAELFSAHRRLKLSVRRVLLYILRDKEWWDEGCLLCNSYIMKGLPWTMNSPWMESKTQNSPRPGYIEGHAVIWEFRPLAQRFLSMLERPAAHGQHGYLPSWCSYYGVTSCWKDTSRRTETQAEASSPPPCPVSQPGCTPRVTGWALLTHTNVSPFSSRNPRPPWAASPQRQRWYIHIQVR